MPLPWLPKKIWPYSPVAKPLPPPDIATIHEGDQVCVSFSKELLAYIVGALEIFHWDDVFTGTESARQDAVGLFQDLVAYLSEAECSDMALRQNPTNPCILQQSYDGGSSWVNVFDFSLCQSATERSVTTYNQYQEIINQGNTYLETIVNNYDGTPNSVAPELVVQNVDTLDEALCYACHHIVNATCDAALGFYDEMSSQGNLLFGVAALVGAVLLSIALPGISAPVLGAVLSGSTLFASVTIGFLDAHQTAPFESQAARDEAACCLFNKLRGSVPTEAEFTQAALDCKAELSGDAHIIVDWLTDSLFLNAETSQEFYLSFLKLAEEGIRPVELGLWSCPCSSVWCYSWDFVTDETLGSWSLLSGQYPGSDGGISGGTINVSIAQPARAIEAIHVTLQGVGTQKATIRVYGTVGGVESEIGVKGGAGNGVHEIAISDSSSLFESIRVTSTRDFNHEIAAIQFDGRGTNPYGQDNCAS